MNLNNSQNTVYYEGSLVDEPPIFKLALIYEDDIIRKEIIAALPRRSLSILESKSATQLEQDIFGEEFDILLIEHDPTRIVTLNNFRNISISMTSPLILILCDSDEEIDRILALELGADDCVAKSCTVREISARVRALLRRRAVARNEVAHLKIADRNASGQLVKFGGWTLDRIERRLSSPSGEMVAITTVEFNILNDLLTHRGRIRSRIELRGGNTEDAGELRSIDVLVSKLRRKLAAYDERILIQTVRGHGYVFILA